MTIMMKSPCRWNLYIVAVVFLGAVRGVIGTWWKTKMRTSVTMQEGTLASLYLHTCLAIHYQAGTGLALRRRLYPREALIEGVMGRRNPFGRPVVQHTACWGFSSGFGQLGVMTQSGPTFTDVHLFQATRLDMQISDYADQLRLGEGPKGRSH